MQRIVEEFARMVIFEQLGKCFFWRNPRKNVRKKLTDKMLKMDICYMIYVLVLFFFITMKTIKVDIPENEYFHHIESQNTFLKCMNGQPIFGRLRRFTEKKHQEGCGHHHSNARGPQKDFGGFESSFIFISVPVLLRKLLIIKFDEHLLSNGLKPPTSWNHQCSWTFRSVFYFC